MKIIKEIVRNCNPGTRDQAIPTVGGIEQLARAGDGPGDEQFQADDFNDFFHHGAEEDQEGRARAGDESISDENYSSQRDVAPTPGVKRGDEPLRRDYEFLRQWEERETGQRSGRDSVSRKEDYGGNYRQSSRDSHSPTGSEFQVGTQIRVVG